MIIDYEVGAAVYLLFYLFIHISWYLGNVRYNNIVVTSRNVYTGNLFTDFIVGLKVWVSTSSQVVQGLRHHRL